MDQNLIHLPPPQMLTKRLIDAVEGFIRRRLATSESHSLYLTHKWFYLFETLTVEIVGRQSIAGLLRTLGESESKKREGATTFDHTAMTTTLSSTIIFLLTEKRTTIIKYKEVYKYLSYCLYTLFSSYMWCYLFILNTAQVLTFVGFNFSYPRKVQKSYSYTLLLKQLDYAMKI